MFLISSGLTQLNSSLTDGLGGSSDKFQFATDGNGNYGYVKKVLGADTFFPFSGLIKGAVFCGHMDTRSAPSGFDSRRWFIFNTDGTCYRTSDYENIGQISDLITYNGWQYNSALFTVKKAGYYIHNGSTQTDIGESVRVSHLNVGDQIHTTVGYGSTSPFCVYLGETNPFE